MGSDERTDPTLLVFETEKSSAAAAATVQSRVLSGAIAARIVPRPQNWINCLVQMLPKGRNTAGIFLDRRDNLSAMATGESLLQPGNHFEGASSKWCVEVSLKWCVEVVCRSFEAAYYNNE